MEARVPERLPRSIGTFLKAFERRDPRQQKAHLQMILRAAYVYNDGQMLYRTDHSPSSDLGEKTYSFPTP